MKISVLQKVSRGAEPGERCCDGCRQPATVLNEVCVPYSNAGSYWRDLCPDCVAKLQGMPNLPALQHATDKVKADTAWDRALLALRGGGSACVAERENRARAEAETSKR